METIELYRAASWQQINARNIAQRSRDNLFAALVAGPSSEWVDRAVSDQKVAAIEYAKARTLFDEYRERCGRSRREAKPISEIIDKVVF